MPVSYFSDKYYGKFTEVPITNEIVFAVKKTDYLGPIPDSDRVITPSE